MTRCSKTTYDDSARIASTWLTTKIMITKSYFLHYTVTTYVFCITGTFFWGWPRSDQIFIKVSQSDLILWEYLNETFHRVNILFLTELTALNFVTNIFDVQAHLSDLDYNSRDDETIWYTRLLMCTQMLREASVMQDIKMKQN